MSFATIAARRWMSTRRIPTRLSADQRAAAFEKISSAWKPVEDRDAIQRTFQFNDFNEAWGFMSRTALVAEEMSHHPEWFNVYNRVEVTLSTHDCNGLSENDITMALAMNRFAESVRNGDAQ